MTKTDDTKECSVVLAFAELDRLERDRAKFAGAKRAASGRLDRQSSDINELRARLQAERARATARARAHAQRERARQRSAHERVNADMIAAAEAQHRERLALYEAELEAQRRRIASLDMTPVVDRPGRRMLEWSIPAAATALVAFLGFTLLGEEQAAAQIADTMSTEDRLDARDDATAGLAELPELDNTNEPELTSELTSEPELTSELTSKPKPKPATSKPKPKPKPITDPKPKPGHSNPLVIGGADGNPLG